MSDRKLATIYVYPPATSDDTWSVTIEPDGDGHEGARFEYPTAAEAFAQAVKWITDRGLRMTARFDVYAPVEVNPDGR